LLFLKPDTCDLAPDPYFSRVANSPTSGNSSRSPCHALSDRTIHKNTMASETRIPNRRTIMGETKFESKIVPPSKIKKTTHNTMLCQA
jgi:hypothetical protein